MKNIKKLMTGIAIIGTFGFLSISQVSAVCGEHQDKKACLQDNKCEWEENVPTPECVGGDSACLGFDKKTCLKNKGRGCFWYVGCKDKS